MMRILIVEDEPTIATGLKDNFEVEGYAVEVVDDGDAALDRILEGRFDLVVLDVMLPGRDGFAVCREARSAGIRTPIIMLTAKGQEVDKVVGLELGADDYVTKPFSPRELLARIKAVIRRAVENPEQGKIYRFGDVVVDTGKFEVTRNGKRIELTATEFKLLQVLLEHRGQVRTIDQLMDSVWGKDVFLSDRVIYTHLNNLRHKIEKDPHNPVFLKGVRSVGYRFDG